MFCQNCGNQFAPGSPCCPICGCPVQYPPGWMPPPYQKPKNKWMSIASLIFGLLGLIAWFLPLVGFPITLSGIVLGAIGIKEGGKGFAIAGIILSVITFLITLVNSALGAYMGAQTFLS